MGTAQVIYIKKNEKNEEKEKKRWEYSRMRTRSLS
jgi:hypothetical protein